MASKPLYYSRTKNLDSALACDQDAVFGVLADAARKATGGRVSLSGHAEPVKEDREVRCGCLYARCAVNTAGHVTGQPTILRDIQRAGYSASYFSRERNIHAAESNHEQGKDQLCMAEHSCSPP